MRWPLLSCLAVSLLAASPEQEIRALMQAQLDTWNRGDIEAFMTTYLDSPELSFTSTGGTTRGYRNVLERYRRNYSTRERMGTLAFTIDEVRLISSDVGLVLGQFRLDRSEAAGGPASGRFSLVVKRTASGWKIVHDHTSS